MRPLRLAAASVLTLAMLAGDVAGLSLAPAPAEAHWRRGGVHVGVGYPIGRYGYGYGYRRYNRVDAGDVIATVAVIAGVAAIASAARRDRDDRGDGGWEDDRGWDRSDGWDRRGASSSDRREDIAVDECREEAERQARTYGTSASFRDIYDVASRGDAVRVRGLVEIARSEVVPGGTERRLSSERFTCVVRLGFVESYQLGGSGGLAGR